MKLLPFSIRLSRLSICSQNRTRSYWLAKKSITRHYRRPSLSFSRAPRKIPSHILTEKHVSLSFMINRVEDRHRAGNRVLFESSDAYKRVYIHIYTSSMCRTTLFHQSRRLRSLLKLQPVDFQWTVLINFPRFRVPSQPPSHSPPPFLSNHDQLFPFHVGRKPCDRASLNTRPFCTNTLFPLFQPTPSHHFIHLSTNSSASFYISIL